MNLWKNWVKLFTWLWQEHQPVLCCQKLFFAYSYTLQRIWDQTLLNCPFHNCRLFEIKLIKPIKPTATNYLLRSIIFYFVKKYVFQRLPFNWKNPIGYLVAVFLQIIVETYHFRYLACFLTFALGGYLFTTTSSIDVIKDLKSVNDDLRSKIDISTKLTKLINLHSDSKQLSATTVTPYEFSVFRRLSNKHFTLISV